MTGYPYRTLFVWIAALALAWLAVSSPWATAWNLLLGGLVAVLAVAAIAVATRRLQARRQVSQAVLTAIDASLAALPDDIRRNTPLVLTVGAANGVLASTFGEALVKITDVAIWVRIDEPNRLAFVADALKRWREGQAPDAVACLVAADEARDATALFATLRSWRAAVGVASRAVGYSLPVCLAVYVEEADGPSDDCPWFGFSGTVPPDTALGAQLADRLAQYPAGAIPADRAARMRRIARLDALAQWASVALLPSLRNDDPGRKAIGRPVWLAAFGVTATVGVPVADSLYAQLVSQTTGLAPVPKGDRRASYAFPDPLIRGIAVQPAQHALPRALAHAFTWLVLAFCAAAAASALQNRALVVRVTDDMSRYRAIGADHVAARIDALQVLKRDRDELERYHRNGVPPRLGLGFYRGGALQSPLESLIAAYKPPEPPPSTIELDSLSLFRSGSAVLNPGSNRVLVEALEMIKAHPDKRVLVAGHTDAVGRPQANLKLSEARAASVRDWLADAAGLPVTHFAIQSYGDTRPKATNDTEVGRAANRRVEITLLPDCRDDRRGNQAISGQSACSFQQKE